MIGVSGCMFGRKKLFKPEEIQKYLSEKYDDTFTLKAVGLETMNSGSQRMTMYSEKLNQIITVEYDPDIPEIEKAVRDNYQSFSLKEAIEKEILSLAEEVYIRPKVFFRPSINPFYSVMESGLSAEELLRKNTEDFSVYVILPPDLTDYEEKGYLFVNLLREKGFYLKLSIIYMEDEESYTQINDVSNDNDLMRDHRALRCDLQMYINLDYDSKLMEWQN